MVIQKQSRNEVFSLVQLDMKKWKKRAEAYSCISAEVKESIRERTAAMEREVAARKSVKVDNGDGGDEEKGFNWKTFKKWFQYGTVVHL